VNRVDPAEDQGSDFVQSLARGLAVVLAFDAAHPRLTLSEVARATGLNRAAARRFLLTLEHLGYVDSRDGLFSLRPRVLELGYTYLSSLSLREVAEPHVQRLAAEVGKSCSLGVLDGDDVVYLLRVARPRPMSVAISVGTRLPAHATSLGRAILAALPQADLDAYLGRVELTPFTSHTVTDRSVLRAELEAVRAQGWALTDQQVEPGLRSLAVPVRAGDGAVVAALNISANLTPDAPAQLQLLPPLQHAAAALEADLRCYPHAAAAVRPPVLSPSPHQREDPARVVPPWQLAERG
jgi:IclR family pca regulon transcriptional regulator